MNIIPIILPIVRARLDELSFEEKQNLLRLLSHAIGILQSGDGDLIGLMLDEFDVSDVKIRTLIVREFTHENSGK